MKSPRATADPRRDAPPLPVQPAPPAPVAAAEDDDPLQPARDLATAHHAPHYVRPRIPRRALWRFVALVALMAGAIALLRFSPLAEHLEPERLLNELRALRGVWWAPLVLVGLFAVLAPLGAPVSPLVFSGGVVFGSILGSLYNTLGLLVGATIAFLVARALGRELVEHIFGARLKRVEKRLARRGFWALVQVRLLPIPFVIVNVGAAVTGVPFLQFVASSLCGLLPSTVIYTYFSSSIASSVAGEREGILIRVGLALALLFSLTLLPGLLRGRLRRQRLATLRAQRSAVRQARTQRP
jgi:phospholipase D1/2